jgi:hypothetical protein
MPQHDEPPEMSGREPIGATAFKIFIIFLIALVLAVVWIFRADRPSSPGNPGSSVVTTEAAPAPSPVNITRIGKAGNCSVYRVDDPERMGTRPLYVLSGSQNSPCAIASGR